MWKILPLCLVSILVSCEGEPFSIERDVGAARITNQNQLIGGRNAKGEIGDYKIWNRKVAFIIQDAGLASGYQRYGGNVIDADLVRPEGEAGRSHLGHLFFGFNQRLFWPRKVEIISDGREGRAVIEVTGEDAYFEWLGSFMEGVLPMDPIDCDIAFRYSLGPDDEALKIEITLQERLGRTINITMPDAAFIMGDGLKVFLPGPGFDTEKHSGEFPLWAAVADGVAYGLLGEGSLQLFMTYGGISFGAFPEFAVPASGQFTLTRYLAVAEQLWQAQKILRDISASRPEGTVSGRVVSSSGKPPVSPARVHVLSPQREHVSVISAAADGSFSAALPAGEYLLLAKADGYLPSAETILELSAAAEHQLELVLPDSVPFRIELTGEDARRLPGRISFFRKDGPAGNVLSAGFGEERYQNSTALTIYSPDGLEEGIIPRGEYEIVASRGLEYEMDRRQIAAADSLKLRLTITHAVDSTGYLAGDFHIHAQYSPDSSLLPEFRVATALSEGLELLVMTEHDTIRDFQPVVERLGVSEWVKAITGSEITTYVYGHFNAWPLTEKPDKLNYGGIEWFNTPAPELFLRIRESEKHPVVIQVNHPRAQGIGGYFNAVGLDIASGTIGDYANWSDDFDAIEVFNGGCSNGQGEEVRDFFDMLNRGYRFSVSAASDSHSEFSTLSIPRVYLPSTSGPADFDPIELVDAFKKQRVFVSCGPFVRFSVNGRGLGEVVGAAPGMVTAQVKIEAASWMKLAEFRIIKNGAVAFSSPSAQWPAASASVRFEGQVDIPVSGDCWLALEVKGQGSVYPLSGDVPYALTNPVYIDTDGNGRFDPPLPRYRAR